jgi:hypothetical protein
MFLINSSLSSINPAMLLINPALLSINAPVILNFGPVKTTLALAVVSLASPDAPLTPFAFRFQLAPFTNPAGRTRW